MDTFPPRVLVICLSDGLEAGLSSEADFFVAFFEAGACLTEVGSLDRLADRVVL